MVTQNLTCLGVSSGHIWHISFAIMHHELPIRALSAMGNRVSSAFKSNQIKEPIPKTQNQFRKLTFKILFF